MKRCGGRSWRRVSSTLGPSLAGVLSAVLMGVAVSACGAQAQSTSRAKSAESARAGQGSESARASASAPLLTPRLAGPPCGTAAARTLAASAGLVAMRIYEQERSSSAVSADRRQVEQYAPLLSALKSADRAAVARAVTALVYSHTHVVRLRVTRGGAVLADVGGPYILAPVGGTLRLGGQAVGHYVLSVQDDVGYVKLEKRFVGHPLVLYAGSKRLPLEGTLPLDAASVPENGPLRYRGALYEAHTLKGEAFPSGPLRISLLAPVPGSLPAESCAQIRVAELARVAQRIWARFTLAGAPLSAHVNAVRALTGGLSFVRLGSRQIAGSAVPGPPALPTRGTVRYGGVTYAVSSFAVQTSAGSARVFLLGAPQGPR